MTDINECSICLELLDNTYQLYVLECGHQYHTTCLTDWYKNPIANYKCPLCNEKSDIVNVTNSLKTIDPINIINHTNNLQSNNINSNQINSINCNQINNINSYKIISSTNILDNSNNKNLNNGKKQNCVIL